MWCDDPTCEPCVEAKFLLAEERSRLKSGVIVASGGIAAPVGPYGLPWGLAVADAYPWRSVPTPLGRPYLDALGAFPAFTAKRGGITFVRTPLFTADGGAPVKIHRQRRRPLSRWWNRHWPYARIRVLRAALVASREREEW